MFILSKLFTALVLPPGIFILALLGATIWAKRFRFFFFLCAVAFYGLSTPFISSKLLTPLESPYRAFNAPLQPLDGIIALGGGVIQGQSLPLTSDALKRALAGVMLAKTYEVPLVYTGGGEKSLSEAQGFARSLEAIFSPFDLRLEPLDTLEGFGIVLEEQSRDTYENAQFTYPLFHKERPYVILVTSAYHMRRATLLFEHAGFVVLPYATDFKLEIPYESSWRDYFPSFGSFARSYVALHEYAGILSLIPRGVWKPF